jgi:hypothetical protein
MFMTLTFDEWLIRVSPRCAGKALRRVSLCPWRIGAITAAARVLLDHEHGRTT